jgi:hypothetical protein
MTTSTRTDTPTGPIAPALAVPRVAPARRWRPSLLWLGVALVAVGALIGWRVLTSIGTTAPYLAVDRPVQLGAPITADDLTTVRITTDPALHPIPAGDRNAIIGKYAAVPLVPGTLLTFAHVTTERAPGPGQQLVGIGLDEERLPTQRITAGRQVLLVVTDTNADTNPAPTLSAPQSIPAIVVDVHPGSKDGEMLLNVAVSDRDGPTVASRAAEGRLVVVLTAGG